MPLSYIISPPRFVRLPHEQEQLDASRCVCMNLQYRVLGLTCLRVRAAGCCRRNSTATGTQRKKRLGLSTRLTLLKLRKRGRKQLQLRRRERL